MIKSFQPKLIRLFIWRQWLFSFLNTFAILVFIFSARELIKGFLKTHITVKETLISYIFLLPDKFPIIIPISCLIATLFTINRLQNRNELIAIFSSGFSKRKFIFCILQVASLVAIFQLINNSYITPTLKFMHEKTIVDGHKKFGNAKPKILISSSIKSGKIWYRSSNYYVSYSAYDKNKETLIKPNFFFFNEKNENTKIVKAKQAIGDERTQGRQWQLWDVDIIKNTSKESFPRVEKRKKMQLSLNESPIDFDRIDNNLNTLGLVNLLEFVFQIRRSGISASKYEIFFLEKIVNSFTCLLFTLIPMTILFAPTNRNPPLRKHIIITLLFTASYWVLHNSISALGATQKIPTLVAILAVPTIFTLPLVFYLFFRKHF